MVLLFGLLFQSGHQNARTSVHGLEPWQSLGSKAWPPHPQGPEPRGDLIEIPPFCFSLLHGQLGITDGLPKGAASCCQMLQGDVVQVHLLHFLVAGFQQKEKQVQHTLRGGTRTVTLQGSEDIAPKGPPICLNETCGSHCRLAQLHGPKIQGSVQEALQCWNFNWLLFHPPRTASVGLWNDRNTFLWLKRLRLSEVPRNPLRAPNSRHSISKKSLLSHHGRKCIQHTHVCKWRLLVKYKGRKCQKYPKALKVNFMRNYEKRAKALPEEYSKYNHRHAVLHGLNECVLLLTILRGLVLAWAYHLAHLRTLAMSVTANIWDTSQNMLAALVPAVPLHVSIPLLQMRFFQSTIASGQPLPLLPRNFRTCSSSCTIFSDSHCFRGAMAAVKIPKLQDLESATTSAKTAAVIHASRRNGWLHRNQKKFHVKEGTTRYKKKPLDFYSTNFKVCQSPFQNLRCLAPSDKRRVETDISLLYHSHSVPLDSSPHQSPHTSRWIQSPSWQTHSEPHHSCSWTPSLVISLCRSMNVEKKIRANSNESWQVMVKCSGCPISRPGCKMSVQPEELANVDQFYIVMSKNGKKQVVFYNLFRGTKFLKTYHHPMFKILLLPLCFIQQEKTMYSNSIGKPVTYILHR